MIDPDTLPWSCEAEQSVLGGLLLDGSAWQRVAGVVEARHFFNSAHRRIFTAIESLRDADKPADIITVFERLADDAEEIGGLSYLNSLASSVPSATSVRHYADIVREKHADRALRETADECLTIAQSKGTTIARLDRITQRIGQLARGHARSEPIALSTIVRERVEYLSDLAERGNDKPLATPTRLTQWDELLNGGMRPGRLYLLGGRPSLGKSALAQWVGLQQARHDGQVVLFLSQEMPKDEMGDRSMSQLARVPFDAIQRGNLCSDQWADLARAQDMAAKLEFQVDDQAALTIQDIRLKARSVPNVGLVVVDYVQLCKGAEEGDVNRNTELEIISRGLKELAKELNCAVLALSQLARRVEERPHKRPLMMDLKDCGGLEQDADVIAVLFPIREHAGRGRQLIGLDVLKNRQGKRGSLVLEFEGAMLSWWDSEYDVATLLAPPPPPVKSKAPVDRFEKEL